MTFDQFRQASLAGVLDALIAENGVPFHVAERAKQIVNRGAWRNSHPLVDAFVRGQAVDIQAATAILECDAAALRLLGDACAEAAALMTNNPGSTHQPNCIMGQACAPHARTWPSGG